jgi:hypothetical protein
MRRAGRDGIGRAALALVLAAWIAAARAGAGVPAVPGDDAAIRASHVVHATPEGMPADAADLRTRVLLVDPDERHLSLLDGETYAPLRRIALDPALAGAPPVSPDGRFAFLATRDGRVRKLDLLTLRSVAEIRVGSALHSVALSGDGRVLMAGNAAPHTLVALDARDLALIRRIAVRNKDGITSRVARVVDATPRQSFIATFSDIPEAWEMSWEANPQPVYEGLVHDFKLREGHIVEGPFAPRRSRLDLPIADFFFEPSFEHMLGVPPDGATAHVVHLDVRRAIRRTPLPGRPHAGGGAAWERAGRPVLALPNCAEGVVSVLDRATWQVVRHVAVDAPGCALAHHDASPYVWLGGFDGALRGCFVVIDKATLEAAGRVCPQPGAVAARLVFSRDGRHALASVGSTLVVYDSATLREVKRVPLQAASLAEPDI